MYTDDNEGGLAAYTEYSAAATGPSGDSISKWTWRELTWQYAGDIKIYDCGSATSNKYQGRSDADKNNTEAYKGHYGMNTYGGNCVADTSYTNPSAFCMIIDCGDTYANGIALGNPAAGGAVATAKGLSFDGASKNDTTSASMLHARHSDNVNVTYGDGHAASKKYISIPKTNPSKGDTNSAFWYPTGAGDAD